MRLSLDCAARAANAALAEGFRNIPVTAVATDSRAAVPGSLFVCIPGERVDGHDFAESAADRGACAVLAQHPLPAFAEKRPGVPVLLVEDSVKALGQVAHAWRRTFAGKVVGLTGTAGKTTVKEVLASVLSLAGKTAKTEMNHNNQIGMPMAMLAADGGERFWVMEAGISHAGDMDELGAVMEPDLAIVLNAGTGHTEGLGREGVAWHKTRLFRHLAPGAQAIASADYPELARCAREACPGVKFFSARLSLDDPGAPAGLACTAREEGADDRGSVYRISLAAIAGRPAASFVCHAPLRGESGAENCAAVALACRLLGVDEATIAKGIEGAVLPPQRFRRFDCGRLRLVDDSYNANPLSMGRMLDAAAEEARRHKKGALALVLGEMRELGSEAEACHRELGRHIACLKPLAVFWKGGLAAEVAEGMREGACPVPLQPVADFAEFEAKFKAFLDAGLAPEGVAVLFKGSRYNELEKALAIAERLAGEAD